MFGRRKGNGDSLLDKSASRTTAVSQPRSDGNVDRKEVVSSESRTHPPSRTRSDKHSDSPERKADEGGKSPRDESEPPAHAQQGSEVVEEAASHEPAVKQGTPGFKGKKKGR